MRILHLVHQYPPHYVGGTELYTQTLARAQAAAGHQVAVCFPAPLEGAGDAVQPEERPDGTRVYALPAGRRSRMQVFRSTFGDRPLAQLFGRVLEAERPDLVHMQHLMGLPAALAGQLRDAGLPYVVTLHDYWYPCANAQLVTNYDNSLCGGPRLWVNCGRCALARAGRDLPLLAPAVAPLLGYRALLLRRVLGGAARIIAPSKFVRRTYEELGMPAGRMVVIPHGIEVPVGATPAERPAHEPGRLHVVYLGSIAWQKGVHVLVQAVNGLLEAGVRLTIYGDLTAFPDYAAELQRAASHPGITFAGPLARNVLWSRLAEADVVAVPSLWYETASLVAQEAFAAGTPVVASRLGALEERVRHEEDGLLLPAGDMAAWQSALLRLRDEPGLLERLRGGIRPVRTIGEHVQEVEGVYGEIGRLRD